jgi:hypothetical protein
LELALSVGHARVVERQFKTASAAGAGQPGHPLLGLDLGVERGLSIFPGRTQGAQILGALA